MNATKVFELTIRGPESFGRVDLSFIMDRQTFTGDKRKIVHPGATKTLFTSSEFFF